MSQKQVVAGLGEIGYPIFQLLSKRTPTFGYDINEKIMPRKNLKNYDALSTNCLHICIPYNKKFISNSLSLEKKFKPECIVIHSTIQPGTTNALQKKLFIPIIYSPTRGIHKRMSKDLKRYTKFYGIEKNAPNSSKTSLNFEQLMKKCGLKTKKMSNPITLEVAKIVVDTSYYGWLINYAQISNIIAKKFNIDYDEMWSFSDEIHKFLGNRPKLFPGFIGGHCVIPNLELIQNNKLNMIDEINNYYLSVIKNAKTISKKYSKGKQSYNSK